MVSGAGPGGGGAWGCGGGGLGSGPRREQSRGRSRRFALSSLRAPGSPRWPRGAAGGRVASPGRAAGASGRRPRGPRGERHRCLSQGRAVTARAAPRCGARSVGGAGWRKSRGGGELTSLPPRTRGANSGLPLKPGKTLRKPLRQSVKPTAVPRCGANTVREP